MSADLQWMLIRNNSCFLVKSLGKTLTKVFLNCLYSSSAKTQHYLVLKTLGHWDQVIQYIQYKAAQNYILLLKTAIEQLEIVEVSLTRQWIVVLCCFGIVSVW